MKKAERGIQDLLKSGNFTIYYHDNGACDILLGHHSEKEISDMDNYEENVLVEYDTNDTYDYIPRIVRKLVDACGGQVWSA